jgi:ubiquinone biosynthesis protein
VTTAAGLRVHVSGRDFAEDDGRRWVPVSLRDVEREPPPEIVDLLPTPLEVGNGGRRPIEIEPLDSGVRRRSSWTLWQFLKFLALGWWRSLTRRESSEHEKAVLLRELFERLSGMWIKLGQLMSLRTDILSLEMCRELSKLQFEVRGFDPDVSRRVIEEDLDRPISAVFSHYEAHPFAAATVAQVHRATLLSNNRAVVVKVMRPDVAHSFERDLRLLERIVRVTSLLGIWKRLRLKEAVRELRAVLLEETNYEQEAHNLRIMRKSLRRHSIYVPRVISRLSRKRVLVMEEVPGVLMSTYIRVRNEEPERAHAWALRNGIEAKEVAKHLASSTLRQILEDNLFHGDLHPGNIVMLADNGLALIDFGSVGRLDRRMWMLYRESLAALAMKDYERAADIMLLMSPLAALANTAQLRRDMSEALRRWELEGQFAGASYGERSMAAMSQRVSKIMANHQVPLTWGIMRVGRSLSTLDASIQTLWPDANFSKLARAYFRDRTRRTMTARGRLERLQQVMTELSVVGADVRLLMGSGLRQQALRLHGVMDRVTHVRYVALTWLIRFAWIAMFAIAWFAFLDEGRNTILHSLLFHDLAVDTMIDAAPDLHPIHWVLLVGLFLFVARFARATRRSMRDTDST